MGKIRLGGFALFATGLLLSACAQLPRERTPRVRAPRVFQPRGELVIVESKTTGTEFRIVLAENASPSTRHGAEELQTFLEEMSGVALPIVSDRGKIGAHEIILGDNAHLRKLEAKARSGSPIDFAKLGNEGYVIRTAGPHLIIAGGALRGNLYGCYGFLEDHLGCRWFAPDETHIPKRDRIAIGPIDETRVPVLENREPFVVDCYSDGDWYARNRMNGNAGNLRAQHGGKVSYYGFVHTFFALVPPEKYAEEHPEYFSEIDGKRIKGGQLCCTNEDVVRIVTEEIRKWMREHPEATVFSVSQNDWGSYCQCEKCQELAKKEEAQIAPVLYLVNRVADAITGEFPDRIIDTLAYQWTRKAPKAMRPRPNVIVRLCSIECCFSHPLATCDGPQNTAFRRDLEEWAKVCNRLWVWDYCTDFSHYFMPFPNRRVLRENIRFFAKNNVKGLFEQNTYTTFHGEFSPLDGYITAKFLWDPDYDVDRAINEFLEAYYGPAARPIREYIDMLEGKVAADNIHMSIWQSPDAAYLTDEIVEKAEHLWNEAQAEAERALDPKYLRRVKIARLSPDYAIIERTKAQQAVPERIDHKNMTIGVDHEFARRLERFLTVAQTAGVARINEWGLPPWEYRQRMEEFIDAQVVKPLQAKMQAATSPGLHYDYFEFSGEKPIQSVADLVKLTPAASGVAKSVGLEAKKRNDYFALRFEGFIQAPRDGVYTFFLGSDDGSVLRIGDKIVVNNDKYHSMETKRGFAGLKAGKYRIAVEFFQGMGDAALELQYAGPGIEKQPVPASALSH